MKVIVNRLPADRPGPDIVNELLTSELAGVERGRVEIDRSTALRSVENARCTLLPFISPGSLVEVIRSRGTNRGDLQMWALVVDINYQSKTVTATTSVSIERVLE